MIAYPSPHTVAPSLRPLWAVAWAVPICGCPPLYGPRFARPSRSVGGGGGAHALSGLPALPRSAAKAASPHAAAIRLRFLDVQVPQASCGGHRVVDHGEAQPEVCARLVGSLWLVCGHCWPRLGPRHGSVTLASPGGLSSATAERARMRVRGACRPGTTAGDHRTVWRNCGLELRRIGTAIAAAGFLEY